MKTTHLRWHGALLCAIWATLITTGCKKTEVNFSINGREDTLPITEEMPTDPNDSQHVISVMANDTVVFQDLSQPANKVKSRQWDFNGDGVPDFEGESATLVLEPGFYKVVLCINGTSQCMARCLYVAPLPEPDTSIVEVPVDTLPASEPEPVPEKPKKEPKKPNVTHSPTPKPPAPKPPRPDPAPQNTTTVVTPKPEKTKPTPAPIKPTAPVDKSAAVTKPATDSPKSGERAGGDPPLPRQPGTAGLPLSGHTDGHDCLDYKLASFSVTLQSKKWVSLQSFRVFTDGCGGVKVSVTGGDVDEQFSRSLVKGRNQIPFGDNEVLLEPGITYTLTCTAFAPYGGCSDSKTPHFEDATDCGGASAQHAALTLNQSGKLFIYDFKFLY